MKTIWKMDVLQDLISFYGKGIVPQYVDQKNCDAIWVLNQKCNTNHKISYDKARYTDIKHKPVSQERYLRIGDIIINATGYGTAGRVAQVDNLIGDTTVDSHMIIIRANYNKVHPKYLAYYMKHNQATIESYAEGSTGQTEISKNRLCYEFKVGYPDLETQKKIAKVLSALDDKIELNNKINKNLEEQIKSIFESWFVTFNHFGGSKPSEMQHVPLEQLCEVVTKGTTPTTMGKAFVSHGVNFIKAETITDSHTIDFERLAHIDNETDSMLKRSRIKKGDILFTIAGTLGRFALVDSDVLPANTNQAVAIIRPNQNKVSSEYLYSFLIANWHNDYYSKRIQQAVQANLSLTTIKSLPIAILSRELAQQYDKLIRKLISLIKANEQENRKLFQFRDTLLPKLMSGEIDVDNVEI